jgi:hypothetical protein
MISKACWKILISFRLVKNLEILDLAMAKVEKVNIAVTHQFVQTSVCSSFIQLPVCLVHLIFHFAHPSVVVLVLMFDPPVCRSVLFLSSGLSVCPPVCLSARLSIHLAFQFAYLSLSVLFTWSFSLPSCLFCSVVHWFWFISLSTRLSVHLVFHLPVCSVVFFSFLFCSSVANVIKLFSA